MGLNVGVSEISREVHDVRSDLSVSDHALQLLLVHEMDVTDGSLVLLGNCVVRSDDMSLFDSLILSDNVEINKEITGHY
jgi:hypothetical protein